MQNYVNDGTAIEATNGGGTSLSPGDPYLLSDIVGIAVDTIAASAAGVFKIRGRFRVPKTTAEAWVPGQKLYWDATAKKATTTVGTNKLMGYAAAGAASADTTGDVVLSNA